MGYLNKYDIRIKKYLSYERELDEIYKKKRKLPLVKLETPYYSGWKIVIDLRDDIKRRNDSDFLYHILEIGYLKNKRVYKKKDVKNIRSGIYWYWEKNLYGKWVKSSFIPDKKHYPEDKYNKFSEREKSYFMKKNLYNNKGQIYRTVYIVNIPKYYIKLRCKPNLITHLPMHDPELHKRQEELYQLLKSYWRTLPKRDLWNFKKRSNEKIILRKIIEEIDNGREKI